MKRTALLCLAVGILGAVEATGAPPVHLEIVQQARGPLDGPQRWVQQLQRLSLASVRVRGPRPGDQPQVQQRGTPERPTFHVTALLTARNELKVPDASFRLGDTAGLARWLENLQPAGQAAEPRAAFGLTERELVKLRKDLATPFRRSTVDRATRSVVAEIQQRIPLSVVIDPTARAPLSRAPTVPDEYQGLAEGTVLAAVLRPAGLAFAPERNERGSLTLRIVAADAVEQVWPIGWPNRQGDQQAVPKLFEFLPVEIVATPLSQALAAIQPRLGVPMLLDRNGLVAQQIDLDAIHVRYPAGRTFYKKLLDRLLFQARLEMTVLVDEGARPFIWIQPIRR